MPTIFSICLFPLLFPHILIVRVQAWVEKSGVAQVQIGAGDPTQTQHIFVSSASPIITVGLWARLLLPNHCSELIIIITDDPSNE